MMSKTPNDQDLDLLIRSRYPIVIVDAAREHRVESLLGRVAARLGVPLFLWTVTEGLRRADAEAALYDSRDPARALANLGSLETRGLYYLKDLPRYLDRPEVVRHLLDLVEPFARDRRALIVSGESLRLPAELRPYAASFRPALPDRDELSRHARSFLAELGRETELEVDLDLGESEALVDALHGLTLFDAERMLARVVLEDHRLDGDDLGELLRLKRERIAADGVLELVPPGGDVRPRGLDGLIAWLGKRSAGMKPGAEELGLEPPRGILLLGVQGCGKSLAARTVARDWRLPLLQLHAGRLYDKYIGETEARLERALETAERMAPAVLWIDEIEKAFPSPSATDADGGLGHRVLGRILGWLQERREKVFVVATCNQARELPPELMRKGRFDELFFVDLPTETARRAIFAAHLDRRGHEPDDFDLGALAEASTGFSGAEIEQAVVAALYSAFADSAPLGTGHVLAEIRTTVPLSRTRAEEIQALRAWALPRSVPAAGERAAA